MTEPPSRAHHGSIARRLVAGSLAIAVASITLLAVVTLVVLDLDIGNSGSEVEAANQRTIVTAIRSAYQASDSWTVADLSPAAALAKADGYGLTIHTDSGRSITLLPRPRAALPRTVPIRDAGSSIGTATISVPASGVSAADAALRNRLFRSVLVAAAAAVLLAFGAAVIGSRRIVAPLHRLTVAVRRLGEGDPTARVGDGHAPGELGELAAAFDSMAATLQRQERLRQAVVADVAHELRTPLAILQGEVEGLLAGVVAVDEAALESLDEEVRRIAALVDDLGVLAAAEAASLTLQRHPVRFDGVVEDALARLTPRFDRQQVTIDHRIDPVTVDGDARRLDQVVVNLLTNALKFSPVRGRVTVTLAPVEDQASLVVRDEGPGIPEAERDRIFDRFFRGTGAADSAGSGIGLAVVRELVAAHGGTVQVDSTPGHGATFSVRLPREKITVTDSSVAVGSSHDLHTA